MTTRTTQTSCPNCRQPVAVEFSQVFDAQQDAEAKAKLLSGQANQILCQACGFRGPYPTPMVYHDAEKELLLTFVPSELGLPMHEQERIIGPLINQIVNDLPQEQRKAYLLQPKTMLTQQTLLETILEGDGVTKEMIDAQQNKLNLLQRLANSPSEEAMTTLAKEEDELIDEQFFQLLQRMVENAMMSQDQALAQRLTQVQELILPVTTMGKQMQEQSEEINAAVESLREAGEDLTREKLLNIVVKAPNDTRLRALVSLARGGMDYEFFQQISARIERARGSGRQRLTDLRANLLSMTQEYDEQLEAQMAQLKQFLEALLETENMRESVTANLGNLPESFVPLVQSELEAARSSGDLGRSGKLQEILEVFSDLTQAPPESEIINALVATQDAEARREIIEKIPDEILPKIAETFTALAGQIEERGDPELAAQVQIVFGEVLQHSMRKNMAN
jgi:hypothetical protein